MIDRDARGIIMGPGSSAAGEGGGAGSSADAGLMDSGAGGAAGFGGASSFGGAAGFGGAVSFGGAAGFGGFVGEDGGSSGAGNPAPTLVGVGITTCSNQRRSYQVVVSTLETRVTGELALATGTTPCEVGAFGERVRFELEPGERETLSLLAPNALPHLSLWYISRDQPATPVHLESVYPDGYF